jgi:hypothetical protein
MILHHRTLRLLALNSVVVLCGCGSGSVGSLSGHVTIDGNAGEIGSITFRQAENPTGRAVGGAFEAGRFEIPASDQMQPGNYIVAVQAQKATGKIMNDPQRGPVPQMQSLELANSPQEIEITSANAGELQLAFTTKKK